MYKISQKITKCAKHAIASLNVIQHATREWGTSNELNTTRNPTWSYMFLWQLYGPLEVLSLWYFQLDVINVISSYSEWRDVASMKTYDVWTVSQANENVVWCCLPPLTAFRSPCWAFSLSDCHSNRPALICDNFSPKLCDFFYALQHFLQGLKFFPIPSFIPSFNFLPNTLLQNSLVASRSEKKHLVFFEHFSRIFFCATLTHF